MSIFDTKEKTYTKSQIKQVLDAWREVTDDKLKAIYDQHPVLKNFNDTQYNILSVFFGLKEKE